MLATDRVKEIFADAHAMHGDALERLAAGDIRDAAEKAWCATLRATNALILARTGNEPDRTPATSAELQILSGEDRRVRSLVSRYYTRQGWLHGQCFYSGAVRTDGRNGTAHPRDYRLRCRRRSPGIRGRSSLALHHLQRLLRDPSALDSEDTDGGVSLAPRVGEARPPRPHSSLFVRTPPLRRTKQTTPPLPRGFPLSPLQAAVLDRRGHHPRG